MLNTRTVIGLGANVFGEGFQEKYIPSFRWGKDSITKFDQFINTAEKMMERRDKTMSQKEKIFGYYHLIRFLEKQNLLLIFKMMLLQKILN